MKLIAEHTVAEELEDIRIYDYCLGLFPQLPSRKSVKKAIDKGEIQLNHERTKTGQWLKGGEVITLVDLENTPPRIYHLELNVIYEDEQLAAVIKPAGVLTSGNAFKTVVNALSYNLEVSTAIDALPWPRPVHRLDKATSGILLVAKTKTAHKHLGLQFEHKSIKKIYEAVVMGETPSEGTIEVPIDGKPACTRFITLNSKRCLRSDYLSHLQLFPETGRTHQLRIHLSEMGNAILGDPIYSPEKLRLKHKGMFLCATEISLIHPLSNAPLKLSIKAPEKFTKRLESEEKRWIKYQSV